MGDEGLVRFYEHKDVSWVIDCRQLLDAILFGRVVGKD